jgi:hypothetical protein
MHCVVKIKQILCSCRVLIETNKRENRGSETKEFNVIPEDGATLKF